MGDGGRLFVGRLGKNTTDRDVRAIFGRYGEMSRCDVRIGVEMGFAFINYFDRRDAEDAIRRENGREYHARKIVVEWAKDDEGPGYKRRAGRLDRASGGRDSGSSRRRSRSRSRDRRRRSRSHERRRRRRSSDDRGARRRRRSRSSRARRDRDDSRSRERSSKHHRRERDSSRGNDRRERSESGRRDRSGSEQSEAHGDNFVDVSPKREERNSRSKSRSNTPKSNRSATPDAAAEKSANGTETASSMDVKPERSKSQSNTQD